MTRPIAQNSQSAQILALGFAGAIAMAAAMGFGRFSYTPILPGMMAGLGLSASDAGLIAAANFAGYLAGAVLAAYGWATGRERLVSVAALAATALLLLAMGVSSSVAAFMLIRFFAGVASAFAMIFTTSVVLGHALAARSGSVQAIHFGGVGLGIATSSLMVMLLSTFAGGGGDNWRLDWLVGAGFAAFATLVAWRFLPAGAPRAKTPVVEPPLEWKLPQLLITLSYGLFGFGYVITATFLITMARISAAGPMIEFLAWFITGLAAAVCLFVWKPVVMRLGLAGAYVAALAVEAIGVLASVMLSPTVAPLVGGLLLGLTFITITAYGLQIGRKLSPDSPRRALAFMTAAFGTGQIAGPLVAGWVAEMTGSFTMPTILGAVALVVCILLTLPVMRRIS